MPFTCWPATGWSRGGRAGGRARQVTPAANPLAAHPVLGLLAPAGTPAAVLERLNAAINLALAGPPLRGALRAADKLPTGGSADDVAQQIRQEHAQHRALLQQAPITLD